MAPQEHFTLVLTCPDTKGIVSRVSAFLFENDALIVESSQFNDPNTSHFYMRCVFRADGERFPSIAKLREAFMAIAQAFGMSWSMHSSLERPKVLIAVSKFGHCLYDLLHRWRSGLLQIDIPAVISNHDDMRSFVEWNGIPYIHLPVEKDSKSEQETKILELVREQKIDLVVLARYMQVLSPELCAAFTGRCINIHHSFLPSFKGAMPYRQAHARGVKIIGATAHFVTTDLDEGPIIEQDVQRITHAHGAQDLVTLGRDVECRVLARAVTWHIEHRVIAAGQKTVVFS